MGIIWDSKQRHGRKYSSKRLVPRLLELEQYFSSTGKAYGIKSRVKSWSLLKYWLDVFFSLFSIICRKQI